MSERWERDVLLTSLAWMDDLWDEGAGLLRSTDASHHMVRETAWYALGLLQRGDAGRAGRAFENVIANQFDRNGAPYDGTFRRAPEEPDPPDDPVMWLHYDPNWRQFIGTALAVACDRFAGDLPSGLVDRMLLSIGRSVTGERDGRVAPTYANIALMKSWLDCWAGARFGDRDRLEIGEREARNVARHFDEHGCFLEYNSPTFYGIDLWALGLWRTSTDTLQELAARIEPVLWTDIARLYHAGMRNMCGPYDRAYGMDMTRYATPLGLWIWAAAGRESAPFPDPSKRFGHPHDFCFGPLVSAVGSRIPASVIGHLTAFAGERRVEQAISTDPRRTATAWLSRNVMVGAQSGLPSGIGPMQHRHATAHWTASDGSVGWLHLKPEVPADATATAGSLAVETRTSAPIAFELHARAAAIGMERWDLDGIAVEFETNAQACALSEDGRVVTCEPASDGATTVCLRF